MHIHFRERPSRSLAKAVTFRVLVLISDFTVIFIITGKIELTATIVIASNIASTFIYYFHERAWNHIHFGKYLHKGNGEWFKKLK